MYSVNIEALVCDAPARAYLKSIKTHTSSESCERCTVRGQFRERRIVFHTSNQDCTPHTDEGFNRLEYTQHQTGISPFIEVGFPCVTGFTLDYMHMVCLGVVRHSLLSFFSLLSLVSCLLSSLHSSIKNLIIMYTSRQQPPVTLSKFLQGNFQVFFCSQEMQHLA